VNALDPADAGTEATRFAWSTDRDPDWWLTLIAVDIRTAHDAVRGGHSYLEVVGQDAPMHVWDWLLARITYLLGLAETKEKNDA
jgi:hypothetical protein